ncbi:MAG: amino acid transporter [Desulfobulbus propionicus]|nr:MAG: amino acid transporter [Desulfobulbus propionicus]
MEGFISGLLLGFSLILAIGAQNAFLLKQGLRREYVFLLCLLCAGSDALLLSVGIFGFAWIAEKIPYVEKYALVGGVAFLLFYGAKSFWSALKKDEALIAAQDKKTPLIAAVLTCLAFTWLNPHVYLDTVLVMGSISTQFPQQKYQFFSGAVLASFLFFFLLGYGARLLSPLFRQPVAWKILDVLIGGVMWFIAGTLLTNSLFR